MNTTGLLQLLQTANGDPAQLALIAVDVALEDLRDEERTKVKRALVAASVPHWYDSSILAALLDEGSDDVERLVSCLEMLHVVEPFGARGQRAFNVHESTRRALRRDLAGTEPRVFRQISERARDRFARMPEPASRMEALYHRMFTAPEAGAQELAEMVGAWWPASDPETRDLLLPVVRELLEEDALERPALLWVALAETSLSLSQGDQPRYSFEELLALSRAGGLPVEQGETAAIVGYVLARVALREGKVRKAEMIAARALARCRSRWWRPARWWRPRVAPGWEAVLLRVQAEAKKESLGAPREAVKLLERAVRLLDSLVSEGARALDKGTGFWRSELATSLVELGTLLVERGDPAAGLAELGRGVQLLMEVESSTDMHAADLADALCEQGMAMGIRGDTAEGRELVLRAMGFYGHLLSRDPSNANWQLGMARVLGCLGELAERRGELTVAEGHFQEALDLLRELVERDPGNANWSHRLAVGLNRAAVVAQLVGDVEVAKDRFGEALELNRGLVHRDPHNAGWQRNLAIALSRTGDVAKQQGDLYGAENQFSESLTIHRRLVERDPGNSRWQQGLAVALNRAGAIARSRGDLSVARRRFREALAIHARLAKRDPENAGWQQGLAVALNRVGGIAEEEGNLPLAQEYFLKGLAISRTLAERDPENAGWQQGLAVALNRVGSIADLRGRNMAPQLHFAEDLKISTRLAERDPTNANWQESLAIALGRMGAVAEIQGELAAAEEHFSQALRVRRKLLERDPFNVTWRVSLLMTLVQNSNVARRLNKHWLEVQYREEFQARFLDWDSRCANLRRQEADSRRHLGDDLYDTGAALDGLDVFNTYASLSTPTHGIFARLKEGEGESRRTVGQWWWLRLARRVRRAARIVRLMVLSPRRFLWLLDNPPPTRIEAYPSMGEAVFDLGRMQRSWMVEPWNWDDLSMRRKDMRDDMADLGLPDD